MMTDSPSTASAPTAERPKPSLLARLKSLHADKCHDILNVLDLLTKNGELRDYDDELANRIEDAKDLVRMVGEIIDALPPEGGYSESYTDDLIRELRGWADDKGTSDDTRRKHWQMKRAAARLALQAAELAALREENGRLKAERQGFGVYILSKHGPKSRVPAAMRAARRAYQWWKSRLAVFMLHARSNADLEGNQPRHEGQCDDKPRVAKEALMAFSPVHIVNMILQRGFKERRQDLTPMKVQKLLFFTHGWHLATTGNAASAEPFHVWKFGPVVPSIYHSLKDNGGGPVTNYILEYVPKENAYKPFVVNERFTELYSSLDIAWEKYIGIDAVRLSAMTHEPGSPWDMAAKANATVISNELIREYFVGLAKRKA